MKPQTRYKSLKKLKMEEWKCKTGLNTRKSYVRCASLFLQVAIPNELLKKRGLVSLLAEYQLRHIKHKFEPPYAERNYHVY